MLLAVEFPALSLSSCPPVQVQLGALLCRSPVANAIATTSIRIPAAFSHRLHALMGAASSTSAQFAIWTTTTDLSIVEVLALRNWVAHPQKCPQNSGPPHKHARYPQAQSPPRIVASEVTRIFALPFPGAYLFMKRK